MKFMIALFIVAAFFKSFMDSSMMYADSKGGK
jgi:hypothetical protein